MVIAALTASSVAPAQVNPAAEPLIAEGPLPTSDGSNSPARGGSSGSAFAARRRGEAAGRSASSRAQPWRKPSPSLRSSEPGSRELECLAVGIYFEAKSESLAGQLAVGHVIANRAESGRFPSSYCGVLSPAQPIQLHSRPLAAFHPARQPGLAGCGRDRQDRRPGTASFADGQGAVLPRPPGFAGLAADPRRHARQSRFLPLIYHCLPKGRLLPAGWAPFVLDIRNGIESDSRLFHRRPADRRGGGPGRYPAVLPA